MAYVGTTSASSAQNIPVRVASGIGAGGYATALTTSVSPTTNSLGPPTKQTAAIWLYNTTDPSSNLASTAGYFSDGVQLGMRAGDIVMGLSNASSANVAYMYLTCVSHVISSTGGVYCSTASMLMSSV